MGQQNQEDAGNAANQGQQPDPNLGDGNSKTSDVQQQADKPDNADEQRDTAGTTQTDDAVSDADSTKQGGQEQQG